MVYLYTPREDELRLLMYPWSIIVYLLAVSERRAAAEETSNG